MIFRNWTERIARELSLILYANLRDLGQTTYLALSVDNIKPTDVHMGKNFLEA